MEQVSWIADRKVMVSVFISDVQAVGSIPLVDIIKEVTVSIISLLADVKSDGDNVIVRILHIPVWIGRVVDFVAITEIVSMRYPLGMLVYPLIVTVLVTLAAVEADAISVVVIVDMQNRGVDRVSLVDSIKA